MEGEGAEGRFSGQVTVAVSLLQLLILPVMSQHLARNWHHSPLHVV